MKLEKLSENEKLHKDEGKRMKQKWPREGVLRKLFDGEPEFRIVEKIKDRLRSWVIPDVDGLIKELMVSRGGP